MWFGRSCMCFNNCLISFKKILTFKNDKKNLLPIYIYIYILDALARLLIIDFIVLSQQQKILKSKFYFYLLEIYRIQSFFSIYIRHCHFKFNAFSKNYYFIYALIPILFHLDINKKHMCSTKSFNTMPIS